MPKPLEEASFPGDESLQAALARIPELREEFWRDVKVVGGKSEMNMALEQAGRVADFLEFGELMARDALNREESCGGHFREESVTPEGEALRDDENCQHVAAWRHVAGGDAELVKEPLEFERVTPSQRSYK